MLVVAATTAGCGDPNPTSEPPLEWYRKGDAESPVAFGISRSEVLVILDESATVAGVNELQGYQTERGTSFAAAFVSAAIAFAWAIAPELSASQIQQALQISAAAHPHARIDASSTLVALAGLLGDKRAQRQLAVGLEPSF